jgi:protein required for attachment to host cells
VRGTQKVQPFGDPTAPAKPAADDFEAEVFKAQVRHQIAQMDRDERLLLEVQRAVQPPEVEGALTTANFADELESALGRSAVRDELKELVAAAVKEELGDLRDHVREAVRDELQAGVTALVQLVQKLGGAK